MKDQSGYFINQELMEEMVRLSKQASLVTREMGGALPEPLPVAAFQDVLDLACGPGEWVMQMARSSAHLHHVVGVDKSQRMIAYAKARAEAEEIEQVSFRVMDVTQLLDFPDSSFSLVNGRFLLSFMRREQWPLLLSESCLYRCDRDVEADDARCPVSALRNRITKRGSGSHGHQSVGEPSLSGKPECLSLLTPFLPERTKPERRAAFPPTA